MNRCPRCQTLNPASERACLSCGTSLVADAGEPICANGHPIDPSWATCPYCALLGAAPPAAPAHTRLEHAAGAAEARGTRLEVAPPGAGRRTRLGSVEPEPREAPAPPVLAEARAGGPPTRLDPVAPRAVAGEPARELVAVLAAPALKPGGALFGVRQGKSFLGAHPANDICLREDARVSSEHALLLARNGRFYLSDRMSTNGTWINGEELGAGNQVELMDRDWIRCGSTELVLLVLPPMPSGGRKPTDQGDLK